MKEIAVYFTNERTEALVRLSEMLGWKFYALIFYGAYTSISITVGIIVWVYTCIGFRVVW